MHATDVVRVKGGEWCENDLTLHERFVDEAITDVVESGFIIEPELAVHNSGRHGDTETTQGLITPSHRRLLLCVVEIGFGVPGFHPDVLAVIVMGLHTRDRGELVHRSLKLLDSILEARRVETIER